MINNLAITQKIDNTVQISNTYDMSTIAQWAMKKMKEEDTTMGSIEVKTDEERAGRAALFNLRKIVDEVGNCFACRFGNVQPHVFGRALLHGCVCRSTPRNANSIRNASLCFVTFC